MNLSQLFCILLLLLFCFCNSHITTVSPYTPPLSQVSVLDTIARHTPPPLSKPVQSSKEQQNVLPIVAQLQMRDTTASELVIKGDFLAARQVYEEAYDIIAEYEDNEKNPITPEYTKIKEKILFDWGEVLKKEGFQINTTSSNLLQQELKILQDIIDDERANDFVPSAPPNLVAAPIPHIINEQVSKWIYRFQSGDQRKHFEIWSERAGQYLPMILDSVRKAGLPDEIAYLPAIESGYNPGAVSRANAKGMWQFVASTASNVGLIIDNYIDERLDPIRSTQAAIKHLKDLYSYWYGDWFLALSAYNTSEKRLRRAINKANTYDYWQLGSPLYLETREYVPKFLAAVEILKNPEQYGFNPIQMESVYPDFDEVLLKKSEAASIDVIANAAGTSKSVISELNPALINFVTPLNRDYVIRLPKGCKETFLANFAAIPPQSRIKQLVHYVQKNQTLSQIARLYRANVNLIVEVNKINNPKNLRIGQKLIIPLAGIGYKQPSITAGGSSPNTSPRPVSVQSNDTAKRQKFVYTVRQNDKLSTIARQYGVTVAELQNWNKGVSDPDCIYQNQEIIVWLPKQPAKPAVNTGDTRTINMDDVSTKIHTVQKGENLTRIAKLYNVPIEYIYKLNNLNEESVLHPGDKIVVPSNNTKTGGLSKQ